MLKVAVMQLKAAAIDYYWFLKTVLSLSSHRFQGRSATANNMETYTYVCAE